MVTNWHGFGAEFEHKEGDKTYAVVNTGPERTEDFATRVLKELAERMPILVLNDEGHHCWRPRERAESPKLSGDDKAALEQELPEATVWIDGLDKLNNAPADGTPRTRVDRVVGPARERELARMLAGDTSPTAIRHAAELLQRVGVGA